MEIFHNNNLETKAGNENVDNNFGIESTQGKFSIQEFFKIRNIRTSLFHDFWTLMNIGKIFSAGIL